MEGFAPTVETALDQAPPPPPRAWTRPVQPPAPPSWRQRVRPLLPFLLIVVLPTLMTAAFEYLVAADQYESEAHFVVHSIQQSGEGAGSLAKLFGFDAASPAGDARSITDYLDSHDAVTALGRTMDLPAIFRRPEADVATRLWFAKPRPETLLKYYRRQVKVKNQADTGITTLTVRAFRPADAQKMAETLLRLGEGRVNDFNQRALENGLSVARQQLDEAEAAIARDQESLTRFRQGARNIDPDRSATAQISADASLDQELLRERAALASMGKAIDHTSPQYQALATEVQALETQAAAEKGRLAGSTGSLAPGLGAYESLRLRQQFSSKRYEAAAAAMEAAREQILKQQLFVNRVVEPNLPVKPLYPRRLKIVATVLAGLLLAYGIGWLILAGVREHAA